MLLVPSVLTRLVPADQQDFRAPGIESVEHSVGSALMLDAQFTHSAMPGLFDSRAVGMVERHAALLEQSDSERDRVLLVFRETVPPRFELVGVLERPTPLEQI